MGKGRDLTPRQKRFVEFYCGNGTDAARQAGYKGSDNVLGKAAYELLRNPKIVAAIKERGEKEFEEKIASRKERQAFWSAILRNKDPYTEKNDHNDHYEKPKPGDLYRDHSGIWRLFGEITLSDRIRASELLAKSECDFVQKVEVQVNMSLAERMKRAKKRMDENGS